MKKIFLGPWLHWLVVIALVALGWAAGLNRFHVSEFNPFVIVLIAATVAALFIVLRSTSKAQQVTRDPLSENDDEASD